MPSRRYAGLDPYRDHTQDSYGSSTPPIAVTLRKFYASVYDNGFSINSLVRLSLLLAISSCVYLFFPSRGHKPPPTFRGRLNPHLCLQRSRFPVPRNAKHSDAALYAIDLSTIYILPFPSSPYYTFKVSEHERFALAITRDSFGLAPPPIKASSCVRLSRCSHIQLSQGSPDGSVSGGVRCGVGVFLVKGSRPVSLH